MKIFISGHKFRYELEHIARTFVPDIEVYERRPVKKERDNGDDYAYLRSSVAGHAVTLFAAVSYEGVLAAATKKLEPGIPEKETGRNLSAIFYDIMADVTGKRPVWGILTGVRPVKLAQALLDTGLTDREAKARLRESYRVSADKARLAVDTANISRTFRTKSTDRSYSLYVSIPFCPSRCDYCSFVSKTVDSDRGLITGYLERLTEEIEETAAVASSAGLILESIYIGGGTPTILSETELESLCAVIKRCFAIERIREYTVEAGRPDTITLDKLKVLREYEVSRISVNPQTFDDSVLRTIDRRHTSEDILRAFSDAEDAGFDNINADLIAGLKGDSLSGFRGSLKRLLELNPKSVTIHALTLKRGSFFRERDGSFAENTGLMITGARDILEKEGYNPYYIYRQKGTVDGLENTGYSLPGYECLYNIYTMDELHTILSCGAGGVTKLYDARAKRIERIFNFKYPLEYLKAFDEVQNRKEGIVRFYESII